jgi:hypothetical protein
MTEALKTSSIGFGGNASFGLGWYQLLGQNLESGGLQMSSDRRGCTARLALIRSFSRPQEAERPFRDPESESVSFISLRCTNDL